MSETEPTSVLAKARAKLAAVDEKRARLPRAVCAVCGGTVSAGSGRAVGEAARTPLDARRAKDHLPPLCGFSRRHVRCGSAAAAVHDLTGKVVSEIVASAAIAQVKVPLGAEVRFHVGQAKPRADLEVERSVFPLPTRVPELSGRAWEHVTQDERERLVKATEIAEREERLHTTAHPCSDGACGFCGVVNALRWHASPLQWRDGSAAPLCDSCNRTVRRRPATRDKFQLRALALEALAGVSGMALADAFGDRMRMFCELVEPGHHGTPNPWEIAEAAWGALREEARIALPHTLPEPERSHYKALASAAREAEQARLRDERQRAAEAEARAAGWPVSS